MENSVEVKGLVKAYENFTLKKIDFVLPRGSVVGLIGENGSGKTTLIKCLLEIIGYEEGNIEIFNKQASEISKEDIGVVLDNAFLPEVLNAKQVNTILKNTYKNWDEAQFFNYLETFAIPTNQQIKTLSKGMRKKLEIASALSHQAKLLILDEPTAGLDPIVRSEILDIFADFIQDEEHSILLSSHITSDLEHIADYITMINDGNILFTKTQDELRDTYGILKCEEAVFAELDASDIIRYKKNRYNYEVLIEDKVAIKKKYGDVVIDKATIEDVMLMYVKGETK